MVLFPVGFPYNTMNPPKTASCGAGFAEHGPNGKKVVSLELGSNDWIGRVAASEFRNWTEFG